MQRIIFTVLLAFLLLPASSLAGDAAPKCKVLILWGGHDFEHEPFFAMFDAMPGVSYDKAELPKEMDLLAPGLEKKYDAVVSYDMNHFPVTDEQRANLDRLLQTGMPLLVFHHGIGSYPDWPKYREIAGGAYLYAETEIDGRTYPASDYRHDEDMEIVVADKDHPITRGVSDFTIHDETYKNVYVRPGVQVLLTCDHPRSTREIAWVHRYGKSPVFTIMLGHDRHAYENENLRKLLAQGIEWLVAEKKRMDIAMTQNIRFGVFREAMAAYANAHRSYFMGEVPGIDNDSHDSEMVKGGEERNRIDRWDIDTRQRTICTEFGFATEDLSFGETWYVTFHYEVDESGKVSITSGGAIKSWWEAAE